jgi:4-diphosphocytidyl-2C-methyl-D-erythritol kinase
MSGTNGSLAIHFHNSYILEKKKGYVTGEKITAFCEAFGSNAVLIKPTINSPPPSTHTHTQPTEQTDRTNQQPIKHATNTKQTNQTLQAKHNSMFPSQFIQD